MIASLRVASIFASWAVRQRIQSFTLFCAVYGFLPDLGSCTSSVVRQFIKLRDSITVLYFFDLSILALNHVRDKQLDQLVHSSKVSLSFWHRVQVWAKTEHWGYCGTLRVLAIVGPLGPYHSSQWRAHDHKMSQFFSCCPASIVSASRFSRPASLTDLTKLREPTITKENQGRAICE